MEWPTAARRLVPTLLAVLLAAPLAHGQDAACPPVTRVRFLPRPGHADRLKGGRFTGSNEGQTTEFRTLAEIREAPPEGQWSELAVDPPQRFRFLKLESPLGGWGNIAELEFYSGEHRLEGTPFGTAGSRENSGNTFLKALDGDPATFFDAAEPHDQYAGIDLGAAVQAARPTFSPGPGTLDVPTRIALSCVTPGAVIHFTRDGSTPGRSHGEVYREPILIEKGTVLAAVACTDTLAESPLALAPYRVGGTVDPRRIRTFHIGNSLTDTVDGWLEPAAQSAGRTLDFHRFTIPGAPTDWLWNHPGSGFGDSRYREAFVALAPIDHLVLQPFAGHGRSIDNEADYGGRFLALCRVSSPEVQPWLYVQWPDTRFQDAWAQGRDSAKDLGITPARTWQEGARNHRQYIGKIRDALDAAQPGKPVRIIPAGPALARLKDAVDAGQIAGLDDFFATFFSDDLHLAPPGRLFVAMVHFACLYAESPEGKVDALTSGLTPEQLRALARIAWESVAADADTGASPARSPGRTAPRTSR
jgi:hypothetical protein